MQTQHLARSLLGRLEESLQDALSRYRYVFLLLWTVAYVFMACYRANRKLFWFDELFTIHISRLHSLHKIWSVLMSGADFNPPLLYVCLLYTSDAADER